MARQLMDCRPLCGHPWLLGLATQPREREQAFRLRHDIFFNEEGYRPDAPTCADGRDVDSFDDWCEHLILYDTVREQLIGTCRAIFGAEAIRHGGLFGGVEYDLAPLSPIVPHILQGSRTCVATAHRHGAAFRYLSYGMDLLAREFDARYFLGLESFRVDCPDRLNAIYSYVRRYGSDPEFYCPPRPASEIATLREVAITRDDERHLPAVIRIDLRMGFLACGPPVWDPDFGCHDLLMLGRRDRLTRFYSSFLERIERKLPT